MTRKEIVQIEVASKLLSKDPVRRGCRCGGTCGDCSRRKKAEETCAPERIRKLAEFAKFAIDQACSISGGPCA